jgi:hypothetical protein
MFKIKIIKNDFNKILIFIILIIIFIIFISIYHNDNYLIIIKNNIINIINKILNNIEEYIIISKNIEEFINLNEELNLNKNLNEGIHVGIRDFENIGQNKYKFNKIIEKFAEYKESALNNNTYKVQNYENPDIAVDMLATIKKNINIITKHLNSKYPNDERVKRFTKRIADTQIEEAIHEENSSSYTINKGELMAICLRHKNKDKDFHQIDILMFVIIHELAHIMSVSEGHTSEFMDNFKFLLVEAQNSGIYHPIDYSIKPITYCGVRVTHNPYYS